MSLDLDFSEESSALAESLARFAAARGGDAVVRARSERFPHALWLELAQLGVFSAGAVDDGGGAEAVCAAMESLGRAAFPGPLVGTFVAMEVLDGHEREEVASGRLLVAYGEPPLLPFAPLAGVFLVAVGDGVVRAEPTGPVETVTVLGGEPWGRVSLSFSHSPVLGEPFAAGARARIVGEIARAAYLVALAERIVAEVAAYARTRRQFGRAIGEFQAVAHPLADVHVRLAAARTLARAAACELDTGALVHAGSLAASARLSSSAASVAAGELAHQLYGAVGITLEGPVFHATRRIRQLASQPPGADVARARRLAELGLDACAKEVTT